MQTAQKITPFLWFDNNAEEAMDFYLSVFKDGKSGDVLRPEPDAPALSVTFEIAGQHFIAMNGGPGHPFTDAVSLFISVETQEEVDELWTQLTEDGEEQPCGWVKDKFGLSWQIVPTILGKLLGDPDPERAGRVMQAMLQMKKLVIADLQKAADQA